MNRRTGADEGGPTKRAENRETGDNGQSQIVPAPPPQPIEIGKAVEQGLSSLGIEMSSEAQVDPNEGLNFGDTPVHCTCPHCERSVITFIDHETSFVTYILGFIVWFSLGWMAFWVLPLLWPAFKDVVHHCPRCLNVVARKSRISLPTFRTEVMTCKVGGCAVVLARKYVMIAALLIGTIITVYFLRSNIHLNTQVEIEKGPASMLTWEDFLFDCGPRTTLQHRASTSRSFEDRYRRRTFKWQGEVRHIREGFDVWFLHTKSVVMARMYPSRYPRRDLPDIALLFGEDLNVEVAELNPGDWVEFEGTMTAHGHRGDPEVMILWHIKTIPKPSPLSSTPGGSKQPPELEKGGKNDKHGKKHEPFDYAEAQKAAKELATKVSEPAIKEPEPKVSEPPAKEPEPKAPEPAAKEPEIQVTESKEPEAQVTESSSTQVPPSAEAATEKQAVEVPPAAEAAVPPAAAAAEAATSNETKSEPPALNV